MNNSLHCLNMYIHFPALHGNMYTSVHCSVLHCSNTKMSLLGVMN